MKKITKLILIGIIAYITLLLFPNPETNFIFYLLTLLTYIIIFIYFLKEKDVENKKND